MTSRLDQPAALKLALWSIPVLFGFGAMYQTMIGSSTDVVEVAADLESHEDLSAHPVTGAKLEILVVEQRALRNDVAELSKAVASICAATSADCR